MTKSPLDSRIIAMLEDSVAQTQPEAMAEIKALLMDVVEELVIFEWDGKTWGTDDYWRGRKDALADIRSRLKTMLGEKDE